MTRRHLQRLRRAYREEGLIGLADRRKLREVTPGSETDRRVIAAIEKMLAEPRGRSTVARSVMFTELQRRLDDEYGPGVVPVAQQADPLPVDGAHGPRPSQLRQRGVPADVGEPPGEAVHAQ